VSVDPSSLFDGHPRFIESIADTGPGCGPLRTWRGTFLLGSFPPTMALAFLVILGVAAPASAQQSLAAEEAQREPDDMGLVAKSPRARLAEVEAKMTRLVAGPFNNESLHELYFYSLLRKLYTESLTLEEREAVRLERRRRDLRSLRPLICEAFRAGRWIATECD
jgi:hypothetical protein